MMPGKRLTSESSAASIGVGSLTTGLRPLPSGRAPAEWLPPGSPSHAERRSGGAVSRKALRVAGTLDRSRPLDARATHEESPSASSIRASISAAKKALVSE